MRTIGIIGTGLIGGSMALKLREKGFADKFIGADTDEHHAHRAVELGLVDKTGSVDELIAQSDIIVIAIPVVATEKMLSKVLDSAEGKVVLDVGSTKMSLCESVKNHSNRQAFVATHPMWGTEYSGPDAATRMSFEGNVVVICDRNLSGRQALGLTEEVYDALGMKIVYMDSEAHDLHAAYVSHISHITSFALANTVLEKEKEDSAIFQMASAGFESTVRLAKSNPDMWLAIFKQNRENVLDVLNEHITQLKKFRSCFEKDNYEYMHELMENANKIKRIIK